MDTSANEATGGRSLVISFVVIAYNEQHHIRRCVEAIEAQEGLATHEVIVVDDGSTDATADLVREMQDRHDSLRLIEQANRGRGAARAVGVRAAEGELIAMVDADICLPRTWLATCLASIEEYDVVCGTAVPDGDVTYLYNTFGLTAVGAPAATTIPGGNGLYRRRVFEHVMFDEQLRNGEDIDINHKLLDRGYRLTCLPGLQVEHRERKSLVRSVGWLYQSGRGATRQLFRYRQIRLPDIAFGGALAVVATSWLARSRYPWIARLLMPSYLLATSERHVHGRFVAAGPARYRSRYIGAVVVNAVLIAAYFAGRTVGVVDFCLHVGQRNETLVAFVGEASKTSEESRSVFAHVDEVATESAPKKRRSAPDRPALHDRPG
jgi:glycosyltransferase involved in cell wall biosynthesis